MLTDLLGIRLVLLVGRTIPLPASYEVMSALASVEVTNDAQSADGFQITFSMSKGLLDFSLLLTGTFDLGTRIVLGVVLGAEPRVLIDGIVTHHQVSTSNDPGMSTLTVTGTDVSVVLDLEEKNQKFENQPDFVIFTRLIAAYAVYGLIPQPTPTTDIPIMIQRIPRQQETDLKFIRRMAERNGFVFYVEPVTFGVNTAYFGPENRLSLPQPALTMNMGASTNLESLNFTQDGLAAVGTRGTFTEPITKLSIPIPSLPSLKLPPLALLPTPAIRTVLLRNTANQNPAQAATTAIAAVTNSPDSVTAQGKVDTVRYGSVLRARKLVGVRGAGFSYDGNYFVRRVSHTIARGNYTQTFTLSREGTGSLLPVVRP